MVEDKTISGRIFSAINFTLLAIIALITVLPLVHVVAGSFTTSAELASSKFVLIPKVWSLEAYKFIFSTNTIFKAMGVSIGVTAIGSIFSLFITLILTLLPEKIWMVVKWLTSWLCSPCFFMVG